MTELIPRIFYGDLELTEYPYGVVMDYNLGSGQVAYETLISRLLDGELVFGDRTSNRQLDFQVVVDGSTLLDVAENAAALFRECDKRANVLTLDPGDGFGPSTAFDTFRASMDRASNDRHEINGFRIFDLSIPALPFARSVALTTQPAVAVDATLTVVDDGSSAVGWTSDESAPVVSSGAVLTTEATGDQYAGMGRAGSIDMSVRPYLVIDWTTSVPANLIVYGHQGDEVMRVPSPFGAGWQRSYYYLPGGVGAGGVGFLAAPLPVGGTMSITQIATAASLPDSGTAGHQQTLAIMPGGSARTQGRIEVQHEGTVGLGEVVLYTAPLGSAYNPSMRRWLAGYYAPLVADPAGASQRLDTASWYDIPASTIPAGGYALYATMMNPATGDVPISWIARTFIGGQEVGRQEGTTVVSFTAGRWITSPLDLVTLPPARVGPAGFVRIDIVRGAGSTAVVHLYDTYLFHEFGDLTIANLGIGTASIDGPSRRLRILPPSSDLPGGAVERGHSGDWSDAYSASATVTALPARGHVLHPEGTSVFVYAERTPTNSPASVSATWFKRWHTHAVD